MPFTSDDFMQRLKGKAVGSTAPTPGAPAPGRFTSEDFMARLKGRAPDPNTDPNNLERALGGAISKVPFLPEMLDYVARPFFAIANVADSGVLALQGRGAEAMSRLGDAGRNLASLLPGVDNPTMEQRRSFKDVLTTAGVGNLGEFDVPLIGRVTGKGALGFGLDLYATKGIPKVGVALKGAGIEGELAQSAAKAGLKLTKLGFVRDVGKVTSDLAIEAMRGKRALVSILGRPILRDIPLPDRLGGSVLELVDLTRRGIGKTFLGKAFDTTRGFGDRIRRFVVGATDEAITKGYAIDDAAADIWKRAAETAKAAGMTEDDMAAKLLTAGEKGGTERAKRAARAELADEAAKMRREAEKYVPGPDKAALLRKAAKAEEEAAKLVKLRFSSEREARGEAHRLISGYVADGFTLTQATRAARAVQLLGVDKTMAPFAAQYLGLFRNMIHDELQAGLAIAHITDPALNYITRVLRPEVQKLLDQKGLAEEARRIVNDWYSRHDSTLRRKAIYEGKTIPELDKWLTAKFPQLAVNGGIYEMNPVRIAMVRSRRMATSLKTSGFMAGTADHYSRLADPALKEAGWRDLSDLLKDKKLKPRLGMTLTRDLADAQGNPLLTRLGHAFSGKMVPADIYEAMQSTLAAMTSPNTFIPVFDTFTRTFKLGATALFPEYHARNAVSNIWANFLADVVNPKSYADAAKILRKANADEVIDLGNGLTLTGHELLRRLEGHGVLGLRRRGPEAGALTGAGAVGPGEVAQVSRIGPGAGFFPEGEKAALSAAKLPGRAIATGVRGYAKAGLRTATYVDDLGKVAHVIDKLRSGMSMDEAVLSVKKFLFDYCVDADTEILTRRGWLRYDAVCLSDEALTIDPVSRRITWGAIRRLNVFPARPREMWRWKSGRIDALSTGAHRWLAEGIGVRGGHWTLRPKGTTHFTTSDIIASGKKHALVAGGGTPCCGAEIASYTDTFVRLVAWTVTEGSYLKQGSGVVVSQSMKHNPAYVGELREIADHYRSGGATVSEYSRECGYGEIKSFYFGKGIGGAIRSAAPDKRITPEFLSALTDEQADIFYDVLMKGDGHVNSNGTHIWSQKRADRIDAFQMLCAMRGVRTHARLDRPSGCSHITAYKAATIDTSELSMAREVHDGIVWCPTTETGTWMARRNGTTYWTGNTDLTPFEKTVMRRIVPFYVWSRRNLPLQLESLVTHPGKVATVALAHRALQNAMDGESPIDTTIVPEWIRRRFYGAHRNDDDSVTILSGLGFGLEDLAIFDRPGADFLSMLNPIIKAPLQALTNRDFFRDTELERAEIAPPLLRHFGMAPGGKAFLDFIGFRMVKDKNGEEKYARANPRFLNALRGMLEVGGVARTVQTIGAIGDKNPNTPEQPGKFLTGVRVQTYTPQEQMRQHAIFLLEAYKDHLESMRRQGTVDRFESFYIERDIAPEDPKYAEAKALIRELGRAGKTLAMLRRAGGEDVTNEEAVDVRRNSLRSGGR